MNREEFGSVSVLIVDDDDFQRRVLAKMLVALGIVELHQLAGAAQALQLAADLSDRLDIVVSDLDMPEIDGMEFLRRLAEQNPNVAVLILSSKHESILRSVKLMAREYGLQILGAIAKPAALGILRDHLASFEKNVRTTSRISSSQLTVDQIRAALEGDQFLPFFQPKVELATRRMCGVEALARWRHPQQGILSPGIFISAMELHGLIDQLSWVILEKSAAFIRRWSDQGLNIPVSINFSQASMANVHLYAEIMKVISAHGVAPEQFILEVTETTAMTDVGHSLENLSRLRMKGFGLSIDDFGTGHASFQQLSRVPFTELKIDQTFVTGATKQPHLLGVMESSVRMANNFNLDSVGEGVETRDDWASLHERGCKIGQGYFIGKPMEGEKILDWLRQWNANNPLAA